MKKPIFSTLFCFLMLVIISSPAFAQISYLYPLSSNFQSKHPEAPDLIQVPNNKGLSGEFVTRQVPETTGEETLVVAFSKN